MRIAPTAHIAEPASGRPDRLRPDAKRTQQAGQFALRQLAGRPNVVWAAPVVPQVVIQSDQRLDQSQAGNAIKPERLER